MKNIENKGCQIVGIILVSILAVFIICCLINYKAVYAVFCNLTAKSIQMKENDEWKEGKTYLKVPYSDASDSDYVDIYVPTDIEHPKLLVLVHGGGFVMNDSQCRQARFMYQYFRDHGYACASVNYRLAQEAGFPGAIEDVKACIRFLRANAKEYGFDADRIAIWGESAGGYLACAAAFTNEGQFDGGSFIGEDESEMKISSRVQVLVDYYGSAELENRENDWKALGIPHIVTDIANSWLDNDDMEGYDSVITYWLRGKLKDKKEADLTQYIGQNLSEKSDLAVWIEHGNCDLTVPYLQSERLYEKLSKIIGSSNVHFQLIPGAGHAKDMLYSEEQLDEVRKFLEKHM